MANVFGRPSADSKRTDFDEFSEKQNACTGTFELCQTEIGSFLCNCANNEFERRSAGSNCTIMMNVPKNTTLALGHSNYIRRNQAVSCVTVWLTVLEDHLLTPIAPMLMNVTKKKTHALGRSNYVTMK